MMEVGARSIGYQGEQYCCYFHFVGWFAVSFGFHVDWAAPNVEVHLPFGFIRVGHVGKYLHSGQTGRSYCVGWWSRQDAGVRSSRRNRGEP